MSSRRPKAPSASRASDEGAASSRDLRKVPFAEIFDWAIGDPDAGRSGGYPKLSQYFSCLEPEWGKKLVRSATQSGCNAYRKRREAKGIKKISTKVEVMALLTATRRFAKAANIKYTLEVKLERHDQKPVDRALKRPEIVRLLKAAWGWKWDGKTMKLIADPVKRRFLRQKRRSMARYILLSIFLGTEDSLACRLRWQPAGEGEPPHSWVDLETRELHRLGPDLPKSKNYQGVAVRIPRWLVRQMRRWYRCDRKRKRPFVLGTTRAFKNRRGKFSLTAADAGLADVTSKMLVETFGAIAMRQEGTSLFGLAIALDRSIDQVTKKFGHLRGEHNAEAIAGTRKRPGALGKRKPTSADRQAKDGGRAA